MTPAEKLADVRDNLAASLRRLADHPALADPEAHARLCDVMFGLGRLDWLVTCAEIEERTRPQAVAR